MNISTITLSTLFILCCSVGFAQEAVLTAGGEAASPGGASASYSVGEAVYSDASSAAGSASQGVQQSYDSVVGLEDYAGIDLYMSVFPNPTIDWVYLEVEEHLLTDMRYELYDMNSKLISANQITNKISSIEASNLATGSYFLKVMNSKNVLQSFTIIKSY